MTERVFYVGLVGYARWHLTMHRTNGLADEPTSLGPLLSNGSRGLGLRARELQRALERLTTNFYCGIINMKAKTTARCAQYMGALKNFQSAA